MTHFDLNELPNLTSEECLLGLLKAFPGNVVIIIPDGQQYRAALLPRPPGYIEPSSECRTWPSEAIRRLHEKQVCLAAGRHSQTGEHLSLLMTRIIPKDASPLAGTDKEGT